MCVEGEVELEDMDARFAEDAELATLGIRGDELPYGRYLKVAGTGDALDLVVGSGRTDVRVETAGRRRDQVDRYGAPVARVGGMQRRDPSFFF